MSSAATASAAHGGGPDPHTRTPKHKVPAGACDCHAHVFWKAGTYPMSAEREYDPPHCPVEDYVRMLGALGVERAVIVQPSVYGTDNQASLDAIAAIGADCARGVAIISGEEPDAALRSLHAAGMRGVRLSSAVKGGVGLDRLDEVAARVQPLGWHIDLHLGHVSELTGLSDKLARLAVPVVMDHFGRVRAKDGPDEPGFRALLNLLAHNDHVWVKLSSYYRLSAETAPYRDIKPLVDALLSARPDRLVWGSNWPHPHLGDRQAPNDGDLIDALCEWTSPAQRQAILADNPARLYGFDQAIGRTSA